jgi:hypothetical protein
MYFMCDLAKNKIMCDVDLTQDEEDDEDVDG